VFFRSANNYRPAFRKSPRQCVRRYGPRAAVVCRSVPGGKRFYALSGRYSPAHGCTTFRLVRKTRPKRTAVLRYPQSRSLGSVISKRSAKKTASIYSVLGGHVGRIAQRLARGKRCVVSFRNYAPYETGRKLVSSVKNRPDVRRLAVRSSVRERRHFRLYIYIHSRGYPNDFSVVWYPRYTVDCRQFPIETKTVYFFGGDFDESFVGKMARSKIFS